MTEQEYPTDPDDELDGFRRQWRRVRDAPLAVLDPAQAATLDPEAVPPEFRFCQACGVMPHHPGTDQVHRDGWVAIDPDAERPVLTMWRPLVLHRHHITMRSRGGSDRRGNLRTLCGGCHDEVHALYRILGVG